ncbi:MAG: protease pro-enzyme activation domain-containing protein, partial [Ktedonobacteraceae bacterium]
MDLLPSRREIKTSTRSTWIKRATIVLPLLCLFIFGTLIGVNLLGNASNASAASLTPIKGHVPALVKTSQLVGPTDANQSLSLSIGLQLRNEDSLKSYVDGMSRTQSITAGHHLTSAQIAVGYAPLASSQQSVITYLQSYGFHVTGTLSQHLAIGMQGTVGYAENAFHIQINNYRSSKGQSFYAPATEPQMPASVAALIQNIAGLSNTVHFTHPPVKQQPKSIAQASPNSVTCLGPNTGYFLPLQFATAYNLLGFHTAGFQGEGQNVALIEFDDFNASDVSNYASCYGGGSVPINRIQVDGGSGPIGAGAIEAELDMELV